MTAHNRTAARCPDLERNSDFLRDAFNVGNGIIWQLTLMVVPVCLVIREYWALSISLAVLAVTSVVMKYTWYDRLGPGDMYLAAPGAAANEAGTDSRGSSSESRSLPESRQRSPGEQEEGS